MPPPDKAWHFRLKAFFCLRQGRGKQQNCLTHACCHTSHAARKVEIIPRPGTDPRDAFKNLHDMDFLLSQFKLFCTGLKIIANIN